MWHRQRGADRSRTAGRFRVVNPDGHVIGLDIGATAVRAAFLTLSVRDGHPSVGMHGLGQTALPVGAVVNGVVVDAAAVTAALKELWRVNDFGCHNVVLGVTNQQVIVRDLQMPVLPPAQIALALPFKARDVVALPLDQALIDFLPVGDPDQSTGLQGGLLVAAPRAPILAAVQAVERAGLAVARVDLSNFAALRSIAGEHVAAEAVIDLGAHLSDIVIHHHGIPRVVRTVTQGGDLLTASLGEAMELSRSDAERAKIENGLTGSHTEVARVLSAAIRPLLAEIRSSIQYSATSINGGQVESVALTGGAAALPGLGALLTEQLGVPVRIVPPLQHVRNGWGATPDPDVDGDGYATAVSVGLAMGAAA